jgi:TonB family protein
MSQARVPASVVISLGLHGGLLVFFAMMMREGPKQAAKVVEGVDLIINAPKARPAEGTPKPPPLSTMDFLKLALPAAPAHTAAPAQLSVKLAEHKVNLAEPKLEESAKKDLAPKLQALDLGAHPVEMAKLEVKMDHQRAARTLAALPPLEEVGHRRVKNLPQAIALEDRRREAVAAAGLPAMDLKPTSRRQAVVAAAALQEAAPTREPESKLGSLLPERPLLQEAHPQAMSAPKLDKVVTAAPKLQRRQAAQADVAEPKKGVEIEGPLADRKIASYAVPAFPDWAKDQGILEADVAIRFTVDEDGAVMPGMRITSSSGYGRIDKLAMESLKSWRFASKPGAGVQWGVITFRFVTE